MSKFKKVLCSIVLVVVIIFVIKDSGISAKDIVKQSDTENMRVIATWNPAEKIMTSEAEDADIEDVDTEDTDIEDEEVEAVIMTPKPTLNMINKNKRVVKDVVVEKNKSDKREKKLNKREETKKLAKSFVGKINYLWGGKPSDSDIKGKTVPSALDCSGFIQYIYSSINGKRINELGSTIAISGIQKIKKNELKVGDIGLKLGTGSLYYDADGKAYSEPGNAELSNLSKKKKADNNVKTYLKKSKKIKTKIKTRNVKIDKLEENIKDYETLIEGQNQLVAEDLKTESELEEEVEASDIEELEEDTVDDEVDISEYKSDIKTAKKEVKSLKSKIKSDKKRLKSAIKNIKKWKKIEKQYNTEIEKSIDHVGIYCGTNKKGEQMWCHCSSSGGGVVFQATDIFKHYFRYYK